MGVDVLGFLVEVMRQVTVEVGVEVLSLTKYRGSDAPVKCKNSIKISPKQPHLHCGSQHFQSFCPWTTCKYVNCPGTLLLGKPVPPWWSLYLLSPLHFPLSSPLLLSLPVPLSLCDCWSVNLERWVWGDKAGQNTLTALHHLASLLYWHTQVLLECLTLLGKYFRIKKQQRGLTSRLLEDVQLPTRGKDKGRKPL